MQMLFRKPVAFGPVVRVPPRGTFALEPAAALSRLAERVSALAERSLEANPFLLPEFLEPAIQGLGRKGLRLAVYSDREDLRFFAPVMTAGSRLPVGGRFSIWAHPYAPLGSPLIDRDMAPQVADALLLHMQRSRRTLFTIPHLPLSGPSAEVLCEAATRHGSWTTAERYTRRILYPATSDGPAAFDQMFGVRRRKNMQRLLRQLCEAGAVSFMSARTPTEIETAFNSFVALEVSGWKGRRGTAMARSARIREFARIAVMQLAQTGRAAIDVMRVGERPIAALIRFEQGGLSIPWKIAFDEEFSAFSPGNQLFADETRRWLSEGTAKRVDPVCRQETMALPWPDREPYGTLFISSSRLGLRAHVAAGIADMRATAKAQAKALLRPKAKRKAKPAQRREPR